MRPKSYMDNIIWPFRFQRNNSIIVLDTILATIKTSDITMYSYSVLTYISEKKLVIKKRIARNII